LALIDWFQPLVFLQVKKQVMKLDGSTLPMIWNVEPCDQTPSQDASQMAQGAKHTRVTPRPWYFDYGYNIATDQRHGAYIWAAQSVREGEIRHEAKAGFDARDVSYHSFTQMAWEISLFFQFQKVLNTTRHCFDFGLQCLELQVQKT
jgi:hypothetical protein